MLEFLVSAQAAIGLLSCAHAYEAKRIEQPADPVPRERAAMLTRQLEELGQSVTLAAPTSGPESRAATLSACDRQFSEQFDEVSQWLAKGAGYLGQTPDPAALAWNRKAAAAGSAEGQWRVGYAYRYAGSGVTPDREEAHRWFRLAAALGHPEAALELYADLHADGAPSGANGEGKALLDQALAARLPDAAYHMAIAVFTGVRGEGDPVLAAAWMHVSARQGSELGQGSLPDVIEPLDEKQRDAALALSLTLQK